MDDLDKKIIEAYDGVVNEEINESSNDKKMQMYRDGCYTLKHAFSEFSNIYMKGMGQMVQSKQVMNPKYKKHRDTIATAYERLDDAISKHVEVMESESAQNTVGR